MSSQANDDPNHCEAPQDELGYLQVKEMAELTGVTVRTLHHYDQIGLLTPSDRASNGYRSYNSDDRLRLQQILLLRDVGFPLAQIKETLDDQSYDPKQGLERHLARLNQDLQRTQAKIRSVETALKRYQSVPTNATSQKGNTPMPEQDLFDGFRPEHFEDEVKERWGNTDAYRESRRRTKGYKKTDWKAMRKEEHDILAALAKLLEAGTNPDSPEALEAADRHRLHIDQWFYPCSRAMHAQLAGLYIGDERFKAHFENHATGLAEFLAEAIRRNAEEAEA